MRVTTEENLLEGAIESLTEILKKHPNYADVWNRLGLCFYLRKDYKEARRCFENGLKINSNYADCAVNYAYTLWQMGDVKNGIRRLLKIYGRTQKASIGNTLGRIFVSLGDFRKGIEYLAKSSQARRPLLYKLDFYFAHLLSDDRKKEFKREIRKIVRAEPSYKRFIKTQGLLETRGIHKSKILQMFNTNPNLHLVYVEMANLSASEGDMQRAKKLFLKAETILPDSAHAEYALGQIHFGRNESAAAKRHFRKAIKYDPHFTKSYISLSYIYT
ncbi:MAG: tetratricopeptide repeat protein, partial [Planctomycetota bacterium]|nr:tetratricopeptide repeat protein [Planctomycetota bacterium]